MTFEGYLQQTTMALITEQLILITLFCEIITMLWHDENAKVGAFLSEMSLCGAFIMKDVMSVMGPVMTGLTYAMIVSFTIKLIIMAARLPATVRHYLLVSRCKKACKQNEWSTMAEDICLICQQYCRQIRQKSKQ